LHGRKWRKQFPRGSWVQPMLGKADASKTYAAHQLEERPRSAVDAVLMAPEPAQKVPCGRPKLV
jgi:hypothetical protein